MNSLRNVLLNCFSQHIRPQETQVYNEWKRCYYIGLLRSFYLLNYYYHKINAQFIMAFVCSSNKHNLFTSLSSQTQLSVNQIQNVYSFFTKCNNHNNNDVLTFDEFNRSLGVLSSDHHEDMFILQRLFRVISKNASNAKLSFANYVHFLNLVNYGSRDDKLKHCFKIFDINNKGCITKSDFVKVMFSLCKYIATLTMSQVLINEKELSDVYDEYTFKAGTNMNLTYKGFTSLTERYPMFLDFYDIFNNTNDMKTDVNVKFKKEQVMKFNEVLHSINAVKNTIVNSQCKASAVTLVTEDYIDEVIDIKKQKNNNHKAVVSLKECNKECQHFAYMRKRSSINNTNSIPLQLPCFAVSQNENTISSNFSDESSFINNNDDDVSDNGNKSVYDNTNTSNDDNSSSTNHPHNIKKQNTNYINTTQMSFPKLLTRSNSYVASTCHATIRTEPLKFKIIKPFTDIKDINIVSHLKHNGFNLDQCLIITNKDNFLNFFTSLHRKLSSLFKDLLPNRKHHFKRKHIHIPQTKDNIKFDFCDIINKPFKKEKYSEKGMIHFGNPNLELIINLMIGIKHSITTNTNSILYSIGNDDKIFNEINRFKHVHSRDNNEFKFYDYAPKIFHNIRSMYNISSNAYLKSLGPDNFIANLILTKNKSLRELCSSGKSGSFFYFSYDNKYLLKTISEDEFIIFQTMLKDYYVHITNNKDSLLQRFYGLHMCVFNQSKMHFVVMNNVFLTPLKVHYKYDLKGSTYQRTSRKTNNASYDYNIAMKDLDFAERKETINLLEAERRHIVKQGINDALFLARHNINDYSFLIGIHDEEFEHDDSLKEEDVCVLLKTWSDNYAVNSNNNSNNKSYGRKPFYERYFGGMKSNDGKKVYFFGIIDIFTSYNNKKKMEYMMKSISQGNGISCKPPNDYAIRFKEYLKRIFDIRDTDL